MFYGLNIYFFYQFFLIDLILFLIFSGGFLNFFKYFKVSINANFLKFVLEIRLSIYYRDITQNIFYLLGGARKLDMLFLVFLFFLAILAEAFF